MANYTQQGLIVAKKSGRDINKPLHLPRVSSDMTPSSFNNNDLNLFFGNLQVQSAPIAGVVPWHIRKRDAEYLIPICPPSRHGSLASAFLHRSFF